MPAIRVRPARRDKADAHSHLAIRSKAHWGYEQPLLELCRHDLTVDPAAAACDGERILVAVSDDVLSGFGQLAGTGPTGEMLNLWVNSPFIGHGVGSALFRAICDHARAFGFRKLTIDSDPHTESFYDRIGAIRIGEAQSTVDPDRTLALMEITLAR